jgi:hypothetical protein
VQAVAASGGGPAGLTMAVLYDGTGGRNPRASVRVTTANPAAGRYDLVLAAPSAAMFDLGRLDAADGAATGVRNVTVGGSIRGGVTAAEQAYFAYAPDAAPAKPGTKSKKVKAPAAVAAGVVLPNDALAVVSARADLRAGTVRAASVQGLAFATLTTADGRTYQAVEAARKSAGLKRTLLSAVLAVNPATKRPYAAVAAPAEALRLQVGSGQKVGLFQAVRGGGAFDPRGVVLWDAAADDQPVSVLVEYDLSGRQVAVRSLRFDGVGGSIDTFQVVRNITSTGPLGDVLLRAGRSGGQVLESLTAPRRDRHAQPVRRPARHPAVSRL